MPGHLRKLVDHLKWADAATLESLRAASRVEPRVLQLYGHIVAAEAVWLARLAGQRADVAVWPALSLDEAASLTARNADELDRLVAALTTDDLARDVEYRNSAGRTFRSTVEDILLHIALHGAYHRAQVALLLRDDGNEPAPTDYIAFVRGAAAARTVPPVLAEPSR